MMKKIKWIFLSFLTILTQSIFSQTLPYAKVSLDTSAIVIGQQVNLQIEVNTKNNEKLLWANIPEQLVEGVEVVHRHPIDTLLSKDEQIYHQTLTITSFDSGFYALTPLQFAYQVENDTALQYIHTPSVWLEVATIAVDTTQAFHDIKPLINVPLTWQEILAYVGIIFACLIILGAIVFLITYLIKRKNKQPVKPTMKPSKPAQLPHVIALEQLESLQLKKLWQNGKIKDYYSELTEIIRVYIEQQFDIHAIEMTTDEILWNIKTLGINTQTIRQLSNTLTLADLVKFAKATPMPLENDSVFNYSVDFVKETTSYHTIQAEFTNQDSIDSAIALTQTDSRDNILSRQDNVEQDNVMQ